MLPNYAQPFAQAGPVFVPLYRQASLYTALSLFDDALEARAFAYGDIVAAFVAFRREIGDRPFILAGVEQGGSLGRAAVVGKDRARSSRPLTSGRRLSDRHHRAGGGFRARRSGSGLRRAGPDRVRTQLAVGRTGRTSCGRAASSSARGCGTRTAVW